jgi:hypothetical protein
MPQQFLVDQAGTFSHVVLLSCEPKIGFGGSEQDRTKDGTPKWELQLVAGFKAFDRSANEVIKVGMAGERNPAESIPQFTPVQLINFQIGVMDKRGRDGELQGAQIWYRCDAVRPIGAVPNGRRAAEHAQASTAER